MRTVKTTFGNVEKGFFISNGHVYLKLLQSDLKAFQITNINAVALETGGVTKFDDDETVYTKTVTVEDYLNNNGK